MRRSVGELTAQLKKLMTNSVISKMTAIKEIIARHIPVAQVLCRVPSILSENVFQTGMSVAPGKWSSNVGKSSSPSTTHAHTMVKKDKAYTICIHRSNKHIQCTLLYSCYSFIREVLDCTG